MRKVSHMTPEVARSRTWSQVGGILLAAFAAASLLACGGGAGGKGERGDARDARTWARAPVDFYAPNLDGSNNPELHFGDQTLRQSMRISVGGQSVRVRISNLFGTTPLKVGALTVAKSEGAGRIDPGSSVALLVAGQQQFTVAAGQEVWSDYASIPVPSNSNLAVSMYLPERALARTMHPYGFQTPYAAKGNTVATADMLEPAAKVSISPLPELSPMYWISGVDVRSNDAQRVVVTIGDSITDGQNSTLDGAATYPNRLAQRVLATPALSGLAVINSGIGGNRLLSDGGMYGDRLLARFKRDALDVPDVSHIIVLIGINDIQYGGLLPQQARTFDEMVAGYTQLVQEAHAQGVKVQLGTLLPFGGPADDSTEAESQRQALNTWLRANSVKADAVIDFDQALRDPAQPTRLLPLYDSGDHLHPSDEGYAAMANAVDLASLR